MGHTTSRILSYVKQEKQMEGIEKRQIMYSKPFLDLSLSDEDSAEDNTYMPPDGYIFDDGSISSCDENNDEYVQEDILDLFERFGNKDNEQNKRILVRIARLIKGEHYIEWRKSMEGIWD